MPGAGRRAGQDAAGFGFPLPGQSTFISRHGLVRYDSHASSKYPRGFPCEIGVCRLRRAAALEDAAESRRKARQRLKRIARQRLKRIARYQSGPLPGLRARQLADEASRLTTVVLPSIERTIGELSGPPGGHGATMVFDHCHRPRVHPTGHGYIRGLVCMACNNGLIRVESGRSPFTGAEEAMFRAYLANCPGCAAEGRFPSR